MARASGKKTKTRRTPSRRKPGESSRHSQSAKKIASARGRSETHPTPQKGERKPKADRSSAKRQNVIAAEAKEQRPDPASPDMGGTGRREPVQAMPPMLSGNPAVTASGPSINQIEQSQPSSQEFWPIRTGILLTRQWMALTYTLWNATARNLMGIPLSGESGGSESRPMA